MRTIATPKFASPGRQRGAIAVMAAVMMITMVMFLAVVVDTGRLYLAKRDLQKNADLAALETALLYCRDHSLVVESFTLEDMDVLSAPRNNFQGDETNSTATVSRAGNAVTVSLNYTVPSSIFGRILNPAKDSVLLSANATATACEPAARLELRTSLAGLDTRASVLNGLLNGALGTHLDLDAASWQGIAETNVNLLTLLDVAIDLDSLPVGQGEYDDALNEPISIGELATVVSDDRVLGNVGGAVGTLLSEIAGSGNEVVLGQLLKIAANTTEAALDVNLSLFDLLNGSAQVAAYNSGATIDLAIAPLGMTTKMQIVQPPQLSPTGNPETDDIFVKSAQVKIFLSFDLSEGIFGPLTDLINALTSSQLVNEVINVVNTLLSLDIVGVLEDVLGGLLGGLLGGSSDPEKVIDPRVLSSPRIDIAILAGVGTARVTDYECDGDYKSLQATATTGLTEIKVGSFGNTLATASQNFSDYQFDNISVSPITILDIGTYEVRQTCGFLGLNCHAEYRTSSGGWSNDFDDADRQDFAAGGITLKMDTEGSPLLGDTQTLPLYENVPYETELPNVDQQISEEVFDNPAYRISGGNLAAGVTDAISGLQIEFHEPNGSGGLGGALSVVGTALQPILNGLVPTLLDTLAPIIDPVVDNIISALGVELASTSVGAALTCENDKVRLVR